MNSTLKMAGLMLAGLITATGAFAQDMTKVRAAVLQIGTVNWELSTIIDNGLDEKYGFDLEMQPYADNGATRVAVEGGEADIAVADWIWVARQRAAGKDYVFVPYSKAVGGVVVPGDSTAGTLADLEGGQIGIAGGPLDKSWLILRAYASQEYDMDLEAATEQVFGAPPLIFKSGISGDLAGAINYWHFLAKMKVEGMRELISVETAADALGLNPDTPLLGYYMKQSFIDANPGIAQALYDASQDSKALMASDPQVWEAIRPQMNAQTEEQFEALRSDYLAGTPARGPVDLEGADRFLQLMADLGGEELVGKATALPEGLFADVK